jgi:ketosteroid isomerase-like protein
MYAGFHGGDIEAAGVHFDPDVVVDVRGRADTSLGKGIDFLLQTIASWVESFDGWREDIEEIRDVDGRVYVAAIQHGRGKETGIEVTQRYGLVYDLENGKITRMTMFPRPEDAAAELGLSS